MSEEEYPAQSFTFVQPQEHTNIPQGSIHPLPQVTLPSFSSTFGLEAPVDNAGMADENLAGQQPTIPQPAESMSDTQSELRTLAAQGQIEKDIRQSPNKRLLARATAELNANQQQENQTSDDQSSATSLASGGPREFSSTLEAAMPPTQKKRRQREPKIVTPTAASSRPDRERKVPERFGKAYVHNVEGLDLPVERTNDSSDNN